MCVCVCVCECVCMCVCVCACVCVISVLCRSDAQEGEVVSVRERTSSISDKMASVS